MKYLIVNADDLGADVYRNQGIAEAVDAGIVTSVSVLVNGPAFNDALARLSVWQDRDVSVGLHVNLSEGYPVCKELAVLPDEHGCFRGKSSTHKLLMQMGNQELVQEVALEIEAQIELLESTGVRISHLDGHQHVHVFPVVIAAAVQAARSHGIAWLRIPNERPLPDRGEANHDHSEILCREAVMFSRLATLARPFLNGSGVRTTDNFRGLYAKGRISLSYLGNMLSKLPPGLTELMVHPGRVPAGPGQGPFAFFSNVDRQGELDVLLDSKLLKVLKEMGVLLMSYPETQP